MRRIAVLALTTLLFACAAGRRPVSPLDAPTPWLESVGFATRADWPSAILHRGRDAEWREDELGRWGEISRMLDSLPQLEVRRPEGEGWGVFFVDDAGEPWCQLSVWVNGNLMARGQQHSPVTLDALVSRRVVDGVEVHLGRDGPIFEDPVCGTVLLWVERIADPSDLPFTGRVLGRVSGVAADTVSGIVLSPSGQRTSPGSDGRFEFEAVPPGLYQATFSSGDRALYVRAVRVYAFRESFIELEVGRPPPP